MNNYKIKQSSPWLFVATLLLTIFTGITLLLILTNYQILPKGQPLIFILFFVPIMILAFYFPKFIAVAEIEILFDREGLQKKWLTQFILHNKKDIKIKWSEIKDYAFQPDRHFDQFKLTLRNGQKFKFFHNSDHNSKDDFLIFLEDFINRVEEINNKDEDNLNDIKLGKTIYETSLGYVMAVICLILIIGLPVFLFIYPPKNSSNYAFLGTSYLGSIYYVYMVYIHRKRRKEYEESLK